AIAVAQPETAHDAASVVRWCAERLVPVVPQGGNTGLSGGCIPDETGRALVLSTARLNKVRAMNPGNNTLIAEAGCTLRQVQDEAAAADRLFPLSLAAEGSCTIGGNLSTNAGGVHVLRYGSAGDLCLGLEVVTSDGEIWDGLRTLRKDNSGYHLRDVFIGAEGTLGIITAAALAAQEFLHLAQAAAGGQVNALELLSEACVALVLRHIPGSRRALPAGSPWYMLVEVSGDGDEAAMQSTMEAMLESALEKGLISDAVIAASTQQQLDL